jgi:hypothetical protein
VFYGLSNMIDYLSSTGGTTKNYRPHRQDIGLERSA